MKKIGLSLISFLLAGHFFSTPATAFDGFLSLISTSEHLITTGTIEVIGGTMLPPQQPTPNECVIITVTGPVNKSAQVFSGKNGLYSKVFRDLPIGGYVVTANFCSGKIPQKALTISLGPDGYEEIWIDLVRPEVQ